MRSAHRYVGSVALVLGALLVSGACSSIPRDTNGALDRVRGGVLRVGIIEHRPWTIVEGDHVSGVEPQLIGAWAGELGARVEWHRGHIEALVDALHRHEIDVLAAGWYVATPYARQLALSQPYVEIRDDQQKTQALALAVSPGESALLFSLDRFLATQDDASILAAASAFQVSQRR